ARTRPQRPIATSAFANSSQILRSKPVHSLVLGSLLTHRFPSFRRSRSPLAPRSRRLAEEEKETMKPLTSSQGVFFPCGLPSLRFFIDEGNDDSTNESMYLLPKRTYQPSHVKRKRTHGYFARSLSQFS
ncbi:ribosomal protein l34, partial [Musa troglodytarum]